jgi:hypothetical protein
MYHAREMKNTYILMGKPKGKRALGKSGSNWKILLEYLLK